MSLIAVIGNLIAKHLPCLSEVVGVHHYVLVRYINGTVDTVVLGPCSLTDRLCNLSAGEEGTYDAAAAVLCTEACIHECLHNVGHDVFIVAPCNTAVR